ncbi:MAG: Spy/CpxP family protein refolding chaperone [Saprospiraceae bacterium]|nr:Spy/CpxP family protein refolding chaperone [Saprospiraceae bacterium]
MKTVRIFSVLFAFFVLGANTSFAQSPGAQLTDEQQKEMAQNMQAFVEVLNLTEEQKPEFESITKKYATQMKAVKENGGGKYKMYRKVKSIQKSKNAEMEKLLSKDQYKTYLEKQKEMQKKMKEKRK